VSAPQPEMAAYKIPGTAENTDHGLVDTPESKPAPRKRTRKPKTTPVDQAIDAAE
ncbi:MAG TPA: DUF4167 domain-containing protein, partial [Rhodobacteraceae bacterium]|nr:DUF4167 domain-containing protein [Paracoccaceae bacterium]